MRFEILGGVPPAMRSPTGWKQPGSSQLWELIAGLQGSSGIQHAMGNGVPHAQETRLLTSKRPGFSQRPGDLTAGWTW